MKMKKQTPDEGFPADGVVFGGEIINTRIVGPGGEQAFAAPMEEEGIRAVSEGHILVHVDRAKNLPEAP